MSGSPAREGCITPRGGPQSAHGRPEDHAITTTSRQIALDCARLCDDKKASKIVVLDVRKLTFIADYFVLCSTTNERQTKAISDSVYTEMKHRGLRAISNGRQGGDGRWMLQDFGDVVVHIFQADARSFYDLDDLWADAKPVAWEKKPKVRATGEAGSGAAAR